MRFVLFSSKVSTLTKLNKYGNIVDETINIWKKVNKKHYEMCEKKSKEEQKFQKTMKEKYDTYKKEFDLEKEIKKVTSKEDMDKLKENMKKKKEK